MDLLKLLPKQSQIMSVYQRFERLVAPVLMLLITLVIIVAVYRLFAMVIGDLICGILDPHTDKMFQSVFGEVMTILIALEFNHTLKYVINRQQNIIQTKVILLIALLALSRKFIILDIKETSGSTMLGLAAITLTLGLVYWLLRERDDRLFQKLDNADCRPDEDAAKPRQTGPSTQL
jgi:uncharacterized membrane protein (DUF373 family)